MSQVEERLGSRKWRFVQSLWMLAGWFPFAMTAWIGYLIIGIRARNWRWLALAGVFLTWMIVMFAWSASLPVVPPGQPSPPITGWFAFTVLLIWLGNLFGLQLWVNRKWLVSRAHREKAAPWYATAAPGPTQPRAFYHYGIDGVLGGAEPPVGGMAEPVGLATFGHLEPNPVGWHQPYSGGMLRTAACGLCGATGSGSDCQQCGAALVFDAPESQRGVDGRPA